MKDSWASAPAVAHPAQNASPETIPQRTGVFRLDFRVKSAAASIGSLDDRVFLRDHRQSAYSFYCMID
jgi:hypothetical protein